MQLVSCLPVDELPHLPRRRAVSQGVSQKFDSNVKDINCANELRCMGFWSGNYGDLLYEMEYSFM